MPITELHMRELKLVATVITALGWFFFNYVLLVASGVGDQPREVTDWEGHFFVAGVVVLAISAVGALLRASWTRAALYVALGLGSGPLVIGMLF